MDKISKECRSINMKHIRSKDTLPEKYLRNTLWHTGIRYRKNYKELPGSPDIYICIDESHPKTNSEFWNKKLKKNIERDQKNKQELNKLGLQVIIVWECTVNKMIKDDKFREKIIGDLLYKIKYGEDLYYEL